MSRRINRARMLVARYTGTSKLAFPPSIVHHLAGDKPTIFVKGNVTEGLATTIGRSVEIGMTLDQAMAMHTQIGMAIDDVAHARKVPIRAEGMRWHFAEPDAR